VLVPSELPASAQLLSSRPSPEAWTSGWVAVQAAQGLLVFYEGLLDDLAALPGESCTLPALTGARSHRVLAGELIVGRHGERVYGLYGRGLARGDLVRTATGLTLLALPQAAQR
jgi:hypothetical protein